MLSVGLTTEQIEHEVNRIISFIQDHTQPESEVVVGVSGGVDSDVCVRLCVRALGVERVKCFTVLQEDMEDTHLSSARLLCDELRIPLIEIPLQSLPGTFLDALSKADPRFSSQSVGDIMRIKLSLRTVIFSMYNEHGYVVISTSNRTEAETGLYMSFGDALGHIKPITHLYKTQVQQVAEKLGTQAAVLQQPPSSGLRKGATDLLDIAHWTQKGGPDIGNVLYSSDDKQGAEEIHRVLTFEKLDSALFGIASRMGLSEISRRSDLPEYVVEKLCRLVESAKEFKGRPLGVSLL